MSGNERASREEVEASRLVAKANAQMSRSENSVRDEPSPGYERNVYGAYFRPAQLDKVLDTLEQAQRLHPLEGASANVRAGYLAWAGRLPESAEAYERVRSVFPGYARPSMAQLAWVYGLMGRLERTNELIERYNAELRAENLPLPSLSIEKLNLGGFS